jgi:NAD-dependent dihydropyrimidine dehydrogenase PreA subunit
LTDAVCLERYEGYLRDVKKSSQNTRSSYLRDVRQLGDYLSTHTAATLDTADEDELCEYIEWLRSNGKSVATVSRAIASIKNFYQYLLSQGVVEHNPTGKLVPDKTTQKLPQILTAKEVETLLAYHEQPEEALDYSVIGGFAPVEAGGKCVYCNHCQPCPMGLDIALINKYYDLAKAGDGMAAEHYVKLDKVAGDCVGCGHCDRRCPFHVTQSERMREIGVYFGK